MEQFHQNFNIPYIYIISNLNLSSTTPKSFQTKWGSLNDRIVFLSSFRDNDSIDTSALMINDPGILWVEHHKIAFSCWKSEAGIFCNRTPIFKPCSLSPDIKKRHDRSDPCNRDHWPFQRWHHQCHQSLKKDILESSSWAGGSTRFFSRTGSTCALRLVLT